MENTQNQILLRGTLASAPAFSHENHGRKFYRFLLQVERLSGTADTLPILAAEDVLASCELCESDFLEIRGQIRSFNNKSPVGRRLIVCVYAQRIVLTDGDFQNEVTLSGTICREPVFRRTPLGREICDVMLAVNRPYHRADYIPCILWGRLAEEASRLYTGTKLTLSGRMQSRTYVKMLEEGSEQRETYEVSVAEAQTETEI